MLRHHSSRRPLSLSKAGKSSLSVHRAIYAADSNTFCTDRERLLFTTTVMLAGPSESDGGGRPVRRTTTPLCRIG